MMRLRKITFNTEVLWYGNLREARKLVTQQGGMLYKVSHNPKAYAVYWS